MKRSTLLMTMAPLLWLTHAIGCSSASTCDALPGTTTSADAGATDAGSADPACNSTVVVGLYGNDKCTPGAEVLTVTFPIAEPCVGWSRSAGGDTVYNSASRFQCFRDRLCYTQYVHNCSCSADQARMVEDKEARTTCLKDSTPDIWVRVLSGTDNCPDAPTGFACPVGSDGNTQIASACGE